MPGVRGQILLRNRVLKALLRAEEDHRIRRSPANLLVYQAREHRQTPLGVDVCIHSGEA